MTSSDGVEGGLRAFDSPGRFWRGNLHTHTSASDGGRATAEVVGVYRSAGYDFIAITDHFLARFGYPLTDASAHDRQGFVTVRGAELHAGTTDSGELWHLVAVGLPSGFPPPEAGEDGAALANRAHKAGAFVAVAHPAVQRITPEEILELGPIDAVETWNGGGEAYDRPDSWYVLDRLLAQGARYTALATDDAHFIGEDDSQRGWVYVKAERLTPTAIVAALKAGRYYSSTGPSIEDIRFDAASQRLQVSCSPVELITATGIGNRHVRIDGHELTAGSLDLDAMRKREHVSPFVRVTVRDGQGARAWSNPIWVDDAPIRHTKGTEEW